MILPAETVTATDPGGLSAEQEFSATVTGPNRAPEAVGEMDDLEIDEDDTVKIALAGYFSDPDGDDLDYSARSSDTDVATVGVAGATLRVAGVGQGTATVTVTATDPGGLSAEQEFSATVTGPNRAPEAVGEMDDLEIDEDDTVKIALADYFSDPDGDDLDYSASSSDTDAATVSVTGATLRVAGAGQGAATVTVTATDPGGLSAEQEFSVTVTGPNRAPEAVGEMDDAETFVRDSVEVALAGYFSDPDGDDLDYSASSSNTDVATVSVADTTLRVAGAGKGAATVTVTATDPGGLSATQTFAVTVPNRAPVVVREMIDRRIREGDTVRIARLWEYISDPDDDDLDYSASSSDTDVATAAVSGHWQDTVVVTGVAAGSAEIAVTASDGSLSATQTFVATVYISRDPLDAYLIQAVQSREPQWRDQVPVPVVADKEALLRVFVTATSTTTETLPPATATFYVDDAETYTVEIDGTSEPIPTEVDEGSLDKSLNVTIPDSVIEEGLSVVIEIDPDSTIDAEILTTKRIPESGELDMGVEGVPDFELTAIPFLYTEEPDSSVIEDVEEMADDEEDHELLHDTYDLLPIDGMGVEDHDPVEIDSESAYRVLSRTRAIRAAESGSGYWMGLMTEFSDNIAGLAYLSGTSSVSVPHVKVIAHELGHNLSLWHAPCGGAGGPDPYYPHNGGSIGAWGYDHRGDSLIDKDEAKDLMSYCKPWWVSDYHFEKAHQYRTTQGMSRGEASRTGPSLLVWGTRSPSGELSMDPALLVEGRNLLPEARGDYTLTGLDDAQRELFSISFDMDEPADAEEGTGIFVFLLPVEPGWEALASLVLAGPGDALFILDGDTEATMALIRDARSGQVRAIRGDFAERPPAPPGHVVRWSRGVPDREAWRLMTGRRAGAGS